MLIVCAVWLTVVILAVSLPALGNHLHQKFSGRNHRHVADAGLVRLQIHFDFLGLAVLVLLNVTDVNAGAVYGFLVVSPVTTMVSRTSCAPCVRLPLCIRGFILAIRGDGGEQNQQRSHSREIFTEFDALFTAGTR